MRIINLKHNRAFMHKDKTWLYEKYIMGETQFPNIGDFFDAWALNGRDLSMEKGHSKAVNKFLRSIDFTDSFSFLDVGCGNGWVVRAMAEHAKCAHSLGIDVSAGMIKTAKSKSISKKEAYLHTDIESYKGDTFDYVFSMESLYYAKSVSDAVEAIWHVLKPGGKFFCGTDYYAENHDTQDWQKSIKIPMHLLSIRQWEQIFSDAGFVDIPDDDLKWRRTAGTLFLLVILPILIQIGMFEFLHISSTPWRYKNHACSYMRS